jgi:hypothetical protein
MSRRALRNIVSRGECCGHCIWHRRADRRPCHRGSVNIVVAHVRARCGGKAQLGGEFLQRSEFVRATLDHVWDF